MTHLRRGLLRLGVRGGLRLGAHRRSHRCRRPGDGHRRTLDVGRLLRYFSPSTGAWRLVLWCGLNSGRVLGRNRLRLLWNRQGLIAAGAGDSLPERLLSNVQPFHAVWAIHLERHWLSPWAFSPEMYHEEESALVALLIGWATSLRAGR